MNEVFAVILSMSLSGGIMIMTLYLLLLLLGRRLCRQWQYYIWLAAVIRLLLPFAPQHNLMNELFRAVEPPASVTEVFPPEVLQDMGDKNGNIKIKSPETDSGIEEEAADKTSDQKPAGKHLVFLNAAWQYLWLIWLVPAIILFAGKIVIYQRICKLSVRGSKKVQDKAFIGEFAQLLEEKHIRRRIILCVNDIVRTPVLVGVWNPRIILPTTKMTVSEFRHTVSHELVHYKRRDILYKWLTQLAVCIHWFNPFVYLMERSINRSCELSCDEAVIWNLDEQGRYAYGDALLQAAGRNVKSKLPVSPVSFSNGTKNLKERLGAIMNFKKISKGNYITMFFFTIVLFICSSYVGVYAAKKENAGVTGKTKTSASYPAQAAHSVLYKDGEYFILFDNAGEKDIPGSTGPDYGVTFGAVWPDAYVSFDSYYVNKNLVRKIKKDCRHFQNKGWLTKKEANAIIDVALKVQKGDTDGFKTDEQEKEYAKWNITRKRGVYYYKNKRIRILMDIRKDRSFQNFIYDKRGKTDIKVVRNSNHKIVKVQYLPKEKAREIIKEL